MKLKIQAFDAECATLISDRDDDVQIVINSKNATALAFQIARAVNRDKHFDALVAALTPFRSNEMGDPLVHMIDIREDGSEQAQARLSRLVRMIDVILDSVEQAEHDDADAA